MNDPLHNMNPHTRKILDRMNLIGMGLVVLTFACIIGHGVWEAMR